MDDFFGEDAWGDEPDWAKSELDTSGSGAYADAAGGGNGGGDTNTTAGAATPHLGAQHVLLLIDCHADMFVPCQQQQQQQGHAEKEKDQNMAAARRRPMDLAIQLAQQLLQIRIRDTVTLRLGKRNGVGVVLYHTKPLRERATTSGNTDYTNANANKEEEEEDAMEEEEDHEADSDSEENDDDDDDDDDDDTKDVHVLIPLDPPGIAEVQTVRACLKGDRDLKQDFACPSPPTEQTKNDSSTSSTTTGRIAPLQTALEEAVRIFRKARCVRDKPTKPGSDVMDTKSIWILTNRSNPYASSPQQQLLIHNVARDAKESGIEIIVWPLLNTNANSVASAPASGAEAERFDMEPFYQEVVSIDAFDGHRIKSADELEDGLYNLQQSWKKVRRLYWGPLVLPDWRVRQQQQGAILSSTITIDADSTPPQIMVDWFRFVQMAKKPGRTQIDQHTKRETIKVKQYLDDTYEIFATFRPGDADDRKAPKGGLSRLRHFATFGGERVPLSPEDLQQIRFLANGSRDRPSLTLLGFKPNDRLSFYHTMDPPYLIYPNDEMVQGSREAFCELHAAMLRKKVWAIGEVLHRVHWSSRLVAMIPLEETLEMDPETSQPIRRQKRPPGMIVVTLPFEDDIRGLQEDEAWKGMINQGSLSDMVKAEEELDVPDGIPSSLQDGSPAPQMVSDDLLQAAKKLVACQRLKGAELGGDFENAALTEFFNYLERVALELPVTTEDEDETFDTRPDAQDILDHAGPQIDAFRQCLPEDVERPASARGGGRAKRKKELPVDDSGLDWEELYHSSKLHEVKVPQLKKYLRSVGGPLSGAKAILVQRVSKHIEQAQSTTKKEENSGNQSEKIEMEV